MVKRIYWDNIQADALKRGELVYAMDQAKVIFNEAAMPPDWSAAGKDGRCVGFALRWIGLRAWGKDYHYRADQDAVGVVVDLGGQAAHGGFAEVPRDQALSRSLKTSFLIRIETVLGQYGVPVNTAFGFQASQPITAALVLERVAAGDGLYYFEMRHAKGAHAIVVQRIDRFYHLFDCNYGHFVLNGLGRFAEYIGEFLTKTDYTNHYDQSTSVARVTAIPPRPIARPTQLLRNARPTSSREPFAGRGSAPWIHSWVRAKPGTQAELMGRRAVR